MVILPKTRRYCLRGFSPRSGWAGLGFETSFALNCNATSGLHAINTVKGENLQDFPLS